MADSQIIVKSDGWKVKIVLGLGGLTVLVTLAFLYRFEFGLILLTLGGIGATRLIFWAKHQYTIGKLQQRQMLAQTRQAELEADRQHWQVVQERAKAAQLAAQQHFIETKAGVFVLGDLPFRFYPSASASRELATSQPLALPAPSLDFFQVMSEPDQAYAIVGTQRVGKSVMAQHLAQYLTTKGYGCLVIGTKANPGEWKDCKRYIGNEQVTGALGRLLAETKRRIENSINAPRLAVFLDDWLNTVALDSALAEQFFLEAATRILTAGIVPYFLLQSDSKADWGTKHGAQLKNNFVHLLLNAPRENGRLDYTRIRATLIYPGDKQQYNVTLPTGLPTFGDSEPSLELAPLPEVEPTEQEQRILEMFENDASLNQIAKTVFGSAGGKQYEAIKATLAKFK